MERQKAVVDASVCAKWFLNEDYSDKARMIRDSFATGRLDLSVPSLLFYETLNALRYSRLYSEQELGLAADSLSRYGFEIWEPRGEVYRETAHVSVKNDVSIYDASYIALSKNLKIPFYTVDGELLRKFPRQALHLKGFS